MELSDTIVVCDSKNLYSSCVRVVGRRVKSNTVRKTIYPSSFPWVSTGESFGYGEETVGK